MSLELAVVALQRLGVAVNVLLHLGFLVLAGQIEATKTLRS